MAALRLRTVPTDEAAGKHCAALLGSTALLFLPGLCCTARLWRPVLRALGRSRGGVHGMFVADPHRENNLAATAQDLLARLPAGPLTVVGHSLGGYLAMELVRQAPAGRVGRLGLVST